MADEIIRNETEIQRVLNWAQQGVQNGSHFRNMKYEEGLIEMFDWLVGNSDDAPDEQE
jgi:hypothetical protein